MAVWLSYTNQSFDLQCKSIDWFLYEGNTGISWVDSRVLEKTTGRISEISENYQLSEILSFIILGFFQNLILFKF